MAHRSFWLASLLFAATACGSAAVPITPRGPQSFSSTGGRVVGVEGPSSADPAGSVRLVLQTEGQLVHVELAPGWVLDERGLRFSKEDQVSIEGRHEIQHGKDVIVARRVRKGTATVELRDERDQPTWEK